MDVILPKMALTMSEATIVEWYRSVGDVVRRGDALVSIETDKVVADVDAPEDGVLAEVLRVAGDVVPAGEVIARLEVESIARHEPAATPLRSVAPAAQVVAAELGVDLSKVIGSGTGGRVIEDDVIRASTIDQAGAARTDPG